MHQAPTRIWPRRAVAYTGLMTGLLVGSSFLLVASSAPSARPAAGSPVPARIVKLGTHRFGHLRAPEAVVASAGPADVAFDQGERIGPWSFEIARDRSVWLLDELNKRLLVWAPGHPNARPRRVALSPSFYVGDFALGPKGTFYVTTRRPETPMLLDRLGAGGRLLWEQKLTTMNFNLQLRYGPDRTLYWVDPNFAKPRRWVPAATPAGRPLSVAAQRKGASRQPLSTKLRLVSTFRSPHELDYTLIDRAGKLHRAWRVTSRTAIAPVLGNTPALIGGDLVVVIETSARIKGVFRMEYEVLRLAHNGPTRTRFSLAHSSWLDTSGRGAWGDVMTDVRIGPGAKLYQLGSSPTMGVAIYRYSIAPAKPAA